jgi:hypothetical protein
MRRRLPSMIGLTTPLALLILTTLAWTRPAAAPIVRPTDGPVYTRDVAPIVYQSCAPCHHPGTAAPFPLLSYHDVSTHAAQIAAVTHAHYMPPWLPASGPPHFAGTRTLTDKQIRTLATWAVRSAPEGPRSALPSAPHLANGWRLGPPDVILRMPRAFAVSPDTHDPCRTFLIPTALGHDCWIRAIDYRAARPAIVRYAALFADPSGKARQQQSQSGGDGWTDFPGSSGPERRRLGEWTRGSGPVVLPSNTAYELKSGTDLVLQLRFQSNGQSESEQSEIGLYLEPKAAPAPSVVTLGASDAVMRPHETATITDSFVLPISVRAFGISPHGGMVFRTIHAQATLPTGEVLPLLDIPAFNPDWAEPLRYAMPILLPAGTRVAATLTEDNTHDNPRNAEGPLMPAMPVTGCVEEASGVLLEIAAVRPQDAPTLIAALRARPVDSSQIQRQGGIGHG